MIKPYLYSLLIICLSCSKNLNDKQDDTFILTNQFLNELIDLKKNEFIDINYLMINTNENLISEEFISQDFLNFLKIDTFNRNFISDLTRYDSTTFYNSVGLKLLQNVSLKHQTIAFLNQKNYEISTESTYFESYIEIHHIYFNENKTKAIINYNIGPLNSNNWVYCKKINKKWNFKSSSHEQ